MTNLHAGQLSQGSLTKRVGKADTLSGVGKPVPWQQWAAGPSGFSSCTQTLSQADWVLDPSSATDQLCDLGILLHLFKLQFCHLYNGSIDPACLTGLWRRSDEVVKASA